MQGFHARFLFILFLLAGVLTAQRPTVAGNSLDDLSDKAVKSMEDVVPGEYDTIAFWQIGDRTKSVDLERFIDKLELKIISSRRFKLIDRRKLDLILKEWKFTHSGLVDPLKMKRLGQVSGVRAFLYGKVVESTATSTSGEISSVTAVLKLVSTKTSHVLWADKIRGIEKETNQEPAQASITKYDAFCTQLAQKLDKQLVDRSQKVVFDFSQLDKQPEEFFDGESFLDSLVVALTKSKKCTVVDRKTLDVLFKEQNLVLDGIVSQEERSRLAKIWGVDAFVYGKIWKCTESSLEGSMKAMDSETGEVFFGVEVEGNDQSDSMRPESDSYGPTLDEVEGFRTRIRMKQEEMERRGQLYAADSSVMLALRREVKTLSEKMEEAAMGIAGILKTQIAVVDDALRECEEKGWLPKHPAMKQLIAKKERIQHQLEELAFYLPPRVQRSLGILNLYPVQNGGKWGYISANGEMVIEPQFDAAGQFSEGLACVRLGFSFGYIDEAGEIVIPNRFELGHHLMNRLDSKAFSDGLACVSVSASNPTSPGWGYIDKTGSVAFTLGFRYLHSPFSEGRARIATSTDRADRRWGFVDEGGNIVISPDYCHATPFSEGLAAVRLGPNDKYAYIDRSGREVITPQFSMAIPFSEGLACIREPRSGKFGYIDKSGTFIIEPRFRLAHSFSEGMAPVYIDGKWGYIDKTGRVVIKPRFDTYEQFQMGMARVEVDGKWGYMDTTGKVVVEPQFDSARPFQNRLAMVTIGQKIGYIDKKGNYIWKPME